MLLTEYALDTKADVEACLADFGFTMKNPDQRHDNSATWISPADVQCGNTIYQTAVRVYAEGFSIGQVKQLRYDNPRHVAGLRQFIMAMAQLRDAAESQ